MIQQESKKIIIIPLLLLGAFLLLPLLHQEQKAKRTKTASSVEEFPLTGFPDYDLIPEELKKRMLEVSKDSTFDYRFYYYFDMEDINMHYFIHDNPEHELIESQPVKQQALLQLVNQRIEEHYGYSVFEKSHPDYQRMVRDRQLILNYRYPLSIQYVLPEKEADLRKLRIGIFKSWAFYRAQKSKNTVDGQTHTLANVDDIPKPTRGWEYFHQVLKKDMEGKLSYFNFYDMKGEVKAEFTIGFKASSPQIIEGFSTRYANRDEAHKLDGLIVKVLNEVKVRFQLATKGQQLVNTRVGISFFFDFDEEGKLQLSISDLYPASNIF